MPPLLGWRECLVVSDRLITKGRAHIAIPADLGNFAHRFRLCRSMWAIVPKRRKPSMLTYEELDISSLKSFRSTCSLLGATPLVLSGNSEPCETGGCKELPLRRWLNALRRLASAKEVDDHDPESHYQK